MPEAVEMAIVNTLKEKGELLDKWRETHCVVFGETDNHNIPSGDSMQISKLAEGHYHRYMYTHQKGQLIIVGRD